MTAVLGGVRGELTDDELGGLPIGGRASPLGQDGDDAAAGHRNPADLRRQSQEGLVPGECPGVEGAAGVIPRSRQTIG
ncbi:hypothetical protein [Actinoallomurus soli]|uniref:hypothetical protein n=1 Tax=Actinoallomurus soli TaxID=2952535 RepID=UPI002092EA1C|nr:hypothetical protein [Actinoallomurus soli]MCO5973038.1 hypothetical protein [Actinoallomurus soli]